MVPNVDLQSVRSEFDALFALLKEMTSKGIR
jgi:hypothetical protein